MWLNDQSGPPAADQCLKEEVRINVGLFASSLLICVIFSWLNADNSATNKQNLMPWLPSTKTWNSWVSVKLRRFLQSSPQCQQIIARNSALSARDGGRSVLMCVWAEFPSAGGQGRIQAYRIHSGNGTSPRRSQGAAAVTSARFSFLSPSFQELVMLP